MTCTTLSYRGIVYKKPEKSEEKLIRVSDSAPHIYRGAVYHYEQKNKKNKSVA
tara:strand:- start:442 stop:600 length:159 start_codon:yes stop_codon:yes gene_type:complete